MIGIIPILMGILLIGNSLLNQNSHADTNMSAQITTGVGLFLLGIILTTLFYNEEKTEKFINHLTRD